MLRLGLLPTWAIALASSHSISTSRSYTFLFVVCYQDNSKTFWTNLAEPFRRGEMYKKQQFIRLWSCISRWGSTTLRWIFPLRDMDIAEIYTSGEPGDLWMLLFYAFSKVCLMTLTAFRQCCPPEKKNAVPAAICVLLCLGKKRFCDFRYDSRAGNTDVGRGVSVSPLNSTAGRSARQVLRTHHWSVLKNSWRWMSTVLTVLYSRLYLLMPFTPINKGLTRCVLHCDNCDDYYTSCTNK